MWISPFHEQKLFQANATPQAILSGVEDSTYLLIRGTVGDSGAVSLGPAWQMSMTVPPTNPPAGTTYCVQLQETNGTLLSQYCFDPEFYDYEADLTNSTDRFEIALPVTSEAARIVVKEGVTIKAQSSASANPPWVQVSYPNGGEVLNSGFTATWQGGDLDGDLLRYHLLYSPDGGLSWQPLATDLTATSYEIDTQYLPGSPNGRLQVLVSDGFFTNQDSSDANFTILDHPPLVVIHFPANGDAGLAPLVLMGSGYDLEEGELEDSSLVWTSSVDGALGTGANLRVDYLSPGWHVLTLTSTDSQNHSSATSVNYEVKEMMKVFLPATRR